MDFHESASDRRQVERVVLDSPWVAEATIGDFSCMAAGIDFSQAGAKIQAESGETATRYQPGLPCRFLVHLPSGRKVPVNAMLSWSFRLPEGHLIGVQFVETVDSQLISEGRTAAAVKTD